MFPLNFSAPTPDAPKIATTTGCTSLRSRSGATVEWTTSNDLVAYEEAVATMEARIAEIRAGTAQELIWLAEHPPLYTAGTSARPEELLGPSPFPVHRSGRGGRYTYHGPGQRVAYLMLDLADRGRDVRCYVSILERWVIAALAVFGVAGEQRPGRIGVWTPASSGRQEAKIAAIGVRVRRWVTFHGVAINVRPDLSHYRGIVPCGLAEYGVTSLVELVPDATMAGIDAALRGAFAEVFEGGPATAS